MGSEHRRRRPGASGARGQPALALIVWVSVLLKLTAAGLGLAVVLSRVRPRRLVGFTARAAAVTLTAYGGVLTLVGLLMQADVIHATRDADHRALAWHAYLWDRGSWVGDCSSRLPCGAAGRLGGPVPVEKRPLTMHKPGVDDGNRSSWSQIRTALCQRTRRRDYGLRRGEAHSGLVRVHVRCVHRGMGVRHDPVCLRGCLPNLAPAAGSTGGVAGAAP